MTGSGWGACRDAAAYKELILRLLFIAPTSNLRTDVEILHSLQGQTVDICDGNVDRDKAERFLRGGQYDYIHFAGHGGLSALEWSDGAVTAKELLGMLAYQSGLRGVVITACHSAGVAAVIHNALHVPVVACEAEISDPGARRFSEAFYRALRGGSHIHEAFDVAQEMLERVYPADGAVVTLINGDMSTRAEMADFETFVRGELGATRTRLERIEETMQRSKDHQSRLWIVALVLLVLLLLAQVASPFLTVAAGR